MKFDRVLVRGVAMSVMVAAGLAIADQSDAKKGSAQQATSGQSYDTYFDKLVGEWSGSVEIVWNEKSTSSSIASASVVAQGDGVLAVVEGFAKGEAFQSVMTLSTSDDIAASPASVKGYDSRLNASIDANGSLSGSELTLNGRGENNTWGVGKSVRQTISFPSNDQCVIAYYNVDGEGKASLMMRYTLDRLPKDQKSDAVALLQDADLLGKVGASPVKDGTATAGVTSNP